MRRRNCPNAGVQPNTSHVATIFCNHLAKLLQKIITSQENQHIHRSEQKIARFRTHYFRDEICIREYSNRAKFNTFLLNHLWEIGRVENDLKEIC
jgi:hypothetical protein